MVRTEHVIDSWKSVRQDTIAAVEEFPAGEFDYRPAPDLQTFGQIGRHILVSTHGLTGMLLAGETDFSDPDLRRARIAAHTGNIPESLEPAELARRLRETVEERVAQLGSQTPRFWAGMMKRVDGVMVTRLEMLQWVKEHELTHRQQLFTYLRMKGMVPATTRRRLARQAANK
ncbi:MAG: DinB family protein [Bryobacteraceae bacterium]